MATLDPVEASVREVLHDISYFEGYDLPASPPETPPTKSDAQMSLRERTPMHSSLERVFPRTPPQSPRFGLKRKFSTNVKSAFSNVPPLTPPATPPTRFGIHSTLAKTVSDTVNKDHQISIVSFNNVCVITQTTDNFQVHPQKQTYHSDNKCGRSVSAKITQEIIQLFT
jgi:hypothetical protein